MNEQESRREYIRREQDRAWKLSVERRLSDIEDGIKDFDDLLRGEPKQDLDGMVSKIHLIQTSLARLNAVVFMDSTGKTGLQHDVQSLMAGEHRWEIHWKFLTTVAVAIISLIGLLATNWDRITQYVRRPNPDPVEQLIDDAKRPKITYRHYTIHEKAE